MEAAAQYFYKKSASLNTDIQIRAFSDVWQFITSTIASPYLWLGTLFVILIFVIWSSIISRIDLSVAVPASSLNFVTVPLVSIIFFHEKVSVLRWVGIVIILLGVIIISLSSKEKKEAL